MRCSVGRVLVLTVFSVSLAIGVGWCPEKALATSFPTTFDWTGGASGTISGSYGYCFTTAPRYQAYLDCWDFAAVAATEASYKIALDDYNNFNTTSDNWCSMLSVQNVADYGDPNPKNPHPQLGIGTGGGTQQYGGNSLVFPNVIANPAAGYGVVPESYMPYQNNSPPSADPVQIWTRNASLNNSALHAPSYTNIPLSGGSVTEINTVKAALMAYGPLSHGYALHATCIVGWNDNYDGAGNGAFLVKDSASTTGGYSWALYGDVTLWDQGVQAVTAPYYIGNLDAGTWTSGASGAWGTATSGMWTGITGQTNWKNGETAATFAGSGGVISVVNQIYTYGITLNSSYTFNASGTGSLTITGNHTGNSNYLNNGGINANANATFNSKGGGGGALGSVSYCLRATILRRRPTGRGPPVHSEDRKPPGNV